jgi:hypothetical protein
MRGAGLLVAGDLDGYAVRTSLPEQGETCFYPFVAFALPTTCVTV